MQLAGVKRTLHVGQASPSTSSSLEQRRRDGATGLVGPRPLGRGVGGAPGRVVPTGAAVLNEHELLAGVRVLG